MAVYRIFPSKDSSIYSQNPVSNTGKDEILEIAGYMDSAGVGRATRSVLYFDTSEINHIVNNIIGESPISASLRLFLAEASDIPLDFNIICFPLSQSWDEGKGKFGDVPIDNSGVSWRYTLTGESTPWTVSNYDNNVTGSYVLGQAGGGCWIYRSGSISLSSSINLTSTSDLDLDIDISNIVEHIYSSSIQNKGIILKLDNDIEFNTTSSVNLKYFSSNTNTIYPPVLEFKWDDTTYSTGSLNVLNSSNNVIIVNNLKNKYFSSQDKIRFRLNARPKFPVRTFTTGSSYLVNYALPTSSYWGLKDEYSNEMTIDFSNFTKISCDSTGPFFDMYTNTLQPERYYRLLVKTEIDGSSQVVDTANIFKLVING